MDELKKSRSDNPDFIELTLLLDASLTQNYQEEQAFYNTFNKAASIPFVMIFYRDNEAIACGALRPYETGIMEIKRMFVRPAHRRQGVSRTVLGALEDWAIELGYSACILETGTKQTEAIQLYTSQGYQPIPNYEPYVGAPSSICMRKDLNTSTMIRSKNHTH